MSCHVNHRGRSDTTTTTITTRAAPPLNHHHIVREPRLELAPHKQKRGWTPFELRPAEIKMGLGHKNGAEPTKTGPERFRAPTPGVGISGCCQSGSRASPRRGDSEHLTVEAVPRFASLAVAAAHSHARRHGARATARRRQRGSIICLWSGPWRGDRMADADAPTLPDVPGTTIVTHNLGSAKAVIVL